MTNDSAALRVSGLVERYYVTPSWVAKYYGVSSMQVHRAIAAKRLVAARLDGGEYYGWALDQRLLPPTFPNGR
jgi:hypothetical protein